MRKQRESLAKETERARTELAEIVTPFQDEPGFAELLPQEEATTTVLSQTDTAEAVAPESVPEAASAASADSSEEPPPSREQIAEALGDPFSDVGPAEVESTDEGPGDGDKPFFTNPFLIVRSGSEETSYLLDLGELAIGKAADNDIVLDEEAALPKHAVVRFEQDHYVVVSLAGDGQLLVNDKTEKRAKLADGDRITIGKSEITFHKVRFDV